MSALRNSARALAACWLLSVVPAARAVKAVQADAASGQESLQPLARAQALVQTHVAVSRSSSQGKTPPGELASSEAMAGGSSAAFLSSGLRRAQPWRVGSASGEDDSPPSSAADQAAAVGSEVLAAKATIGGRALMQATQGVAQEMGHGSVAGAWQAASEALEEASRESVAVDAAASRDAAQGFGILAVFCIVGAAWGVEFLLTKRVEERAEEEREDQLQEVREKLAEKPAQRAPFFHGLSTLRYLLAWHVVLCNFYRGDDGVDTFREGGALVAFSRFGEFAAPMFFLLSGFCNTYSKMVGPNADVQEDWFIGMAKRVLPWYGLFAVALTWCAIRLWSIDAEDWTHYLASLLLIDGVIFQPDTFPFVKGTWWLCYLMVYLVAWSPMHQIIHNSSNSVIWTLFTISFIIVIPSTIFEWYFMGEMAVFDLIQYWPSFVFGQALATWFTRNCMAQKALTTEQVYVMRPVHDIPFLVRFGPTMGFLILGIIFFCISPHDKLVLLKKECAPLFLKGGLLPLLGIMVAGLACEVDPLAKLFARKPFRWGNKLALATFILQTPVHETIHDWTGWSGLTWTFSASLLLVSIVAHCLAEIPYRRLLGARAK